jgi:hypothetical protein
MYQPDSAKSVDETTRAIMGHTLELVETILIVTARNTARMGMK